MVLYKVYSQEHRIRYFADPCSTAVLFQIVCILITFLAPLFTSYFTSGFYYKELTYNEQPNVSYHGQYYLTIDSSSSFTFSSSDARLNNYFISDYWPSTDQLNTPRDINRDNITDQYTVTINLPLRGPISGQIINLWLLFQYTLNRYPLVNTETLGIISLKVPSFLNNNNNVTVAIYGQLAFQQREPILSYKNVSAIQGPIIDYGSYSVVPSFEDILNNYQSRNYSTKFNTQYVQWSSTSSTNSHLTIKVVVNMGTQLIRYVPDFWTEFRWTWIQYVTALLPFYYLMNKVKEFVFSNRLVRTVVKKFP